MHWISLRWISFFFWLALCFLVASIGGRWTASEIPTWYRTLIRPSIAPPNWLFSPVWTTLYLLMAIAVWRVSLAAPSPQRNLAIALFLVQLALNLAWSWIFFRQHWLGWAVVEVTLLWIAIAATTLAFRPVTTLAAWLMVPYLAWVSFASVLNFAYWRLNQS
jgi:tryptophan-rich sensory protein